MTVARLPAGVETVRVSAQLTHRRSASGDADPGFLATTGPSVPVVGRGSGRSRRGRAGGMRDGVAVGSEDVPERAKLVQALPAGAARLGVAHVVVERVPRVGDLLDARRAGGGADQGRLRSALGFHVAGGDKPRPDRGTGSR